MQVIIEVTDHGKKFFNHEVDGTIANALQHSSFAFLIQAVQAGCMCEIQALLLNKRVVLATVMAPVADKVKELAAFVNDIAHGLDTTKPEYKIVSAHCVAAACPENKYHSQWQYEKKATGIEATVSSTLTFKEILDLLK